MKRIVLVLLSVALYLATFAGCERVPDHNLPNEMPEANTSQNNSAERESTPSDQASSSTSNKPVPEPQPSEPYFYQCNSSYHPYYIQKDADILMARDGDHCMIDIPAHHKSFTIPAYFFSEFNCATVVGNTAFIFAEDPTDSGITDVIHMLKLDINTGEMIQSTITLPSKIFTSYLFYNMINDQEGYLFVSSFIYNSRDSQLAFLLKTQDSGASWSFIESESFPQYHWRDNPILALFLDETTAIFSCRCQVEENITKRTFVTFDGGRTWRKINNLPDGWNIPTEIADFEILDGKYIITVKDLHYYPAHFIKLISVDLISWTLE